MADYDLPPGDYRERKPKGWRWKLPWSHRDDVKLPFAMMLVGLGFVGYFLFNLPASVDPWIVGGASMFAFLAGACFMWAFHD